MVIYIRHKIRPSFQETDLETVTVYLIPQPPPTISSSYPSLHQQFSLYPSQKNAANNYNSVRDFVFIHKKKCQKPKTHIKKLHPLLSRSIIQGGKNFYELHISLIYRSTHFSPHFISAVRDGQHINTSHCPNQRPLLRFQSHC